MTSCSSFQISFCAAIPRPRDAFFLRHGLLEVGDTVAVAVVSGADVVAGEVPALEVVADGWEVVAAIVETLLSVNVICLGV